MIHRVIQETEAAQIELGLARLKTKWSGIFGPAMQCIILDGSFHEFFFHFRLFTQFLFLKNLPISVNISFQETNMFLCISIEIIENYLYVQAGLGPESVVILSTHLGGMETWEVSLSQMRGVSVLVVDIYQQLSCIKQIFIHNGWILACFQLHVSP